MMSFKTIITKLVTITVHQIALVMLHSALMRLYVRVRQLK
jgi:hypothetical protein